MRCSPLASPTATRELLDEFGLTTKHRLGQHFLIDDHVVERIVRLAELDANARVVEVGPGIGTLTLALLPRVARVVAIEMDPALEPVLAMHVADHPDLSYIIGDALRVGFRAIAAEAGGAPTMLVANLPYNAAATIILDYLEHMDSLESAVVMVQKEVADRIAAQPGTKSYGAYTAKLRLIGELTDRFEVSRLSFMPPPRVESSVVRIERAHRAGERLGPCLAGASAGTGAVAPAQVASVIDAAFAQRRKTIRNSMTARGFDREMLDEALGASRIAPSIRAEALDTDDFIRLTCALAACGAAARMDAGAEATER
ncbi:dimethyladenosine transferase [Coriobacterium glomerans PW2]|uniref:Ribosomal RNA small subunit methyltransferase A n=1 Tax=Coriobacterium glomerans (strain ATCC 49209 / DSM 20642 / JCM 10262 / PW2) TaxID=700015 RepID=F2NA80_CORGP|nr:16S rRNA (adenine(1518)-N(6)/adenine(1519)-N(6))-dimethyltransferase RsmA [Coriobacterium glomerans]AEB06474.1 dimethyladenosine transferase [Coriobacterium glomerans PW2]